MLKAGHVLDIFGDIKNALGRFKSTLGNVVEGFKAFVELGGRGGTAIAKSLGIINPEILIMGGLIAATVAGIDLFTTSYAEANKEAEKQVEIQKSIEEKIADYHRLEERQGGLQDWQRDELDYYERKLKYQEEITNKAKQESFNKWQSEFGSGAEVDEFYMTETGTTGVRKTTRDVQELNKLTGALLGLRTQFDAGKLDVTNFESAIENATSGSMNYYESLKEMQEQGMILSQSEQQLVGLIDIVNKAMGIEGVSAADKFGRVIAETLLRTGMGFEQATQEGEHWSDRFQTRLEGIEGAAKKGADKLRMLSFAKAHPSVALVADEFNLGMAEAAELIEEANGWTGRPTITLNDQASATAQKIIDKLASIKSKTVTVTTKHVTQAGHGSQYITETARGTEDAKGGLSVVNEEGPELISANGRAYIAGGGEPTVTNLPEGAIVLTADETKRALAGKSPKNIMPAYANGKKDPGIWFPLTPPSGGGGSTPTPTPTPPPYYPGGGSWSGGGSSSGGSSSSSSSSSSSEDDPIKKQNDLFKEQLDLLKHRLFLMEKEEKSEAERIDYIKEIQAEIMRQRQWYIDHGLDQNSKYIQDLEKQWWEYADKIKKLYKDQAKIYETLFGAVANKAQDEIDALNKKKEALENQNDELERQKELEEALDALARAKQQKVLVYKDGKMQYVQDADAVSEAQAEVERIQNERVQQEQLDAIDKQIAKWEEYKQAWGSVAGDYDKNQDLLLLEQKLGIKLEGENWEKRLDSLQSYINKYNDLMVKGGAKKGGLTARGYSIAGLRNAFMPQRANLFSMGEPTPASMMSTYSGSKVNSGGTNITIQNFNPNLPNVQDGQGFVDYLKTSFLGQTMQLATV